MHTPQYHKGDYIISKMPGESSKASYWISKKGNTDAYYCFSASNDQELEYQLQHGFDGYISLYKQNHARLTGRDFTVHTPMGDIRVYAKHQTDCAADFPGVYVDWQASKETLACVEYDPVNQTIQTCVYQPGQEEPVSLIVHDVNN